MVKPENKHARTSTGIRGLDTILNGGLPEGRVFLVQGGPGTGKTTTSFHFLRAGAAAGERVLYISLLQTRDEISKILKSHGWSLEGIDMLELPESLEEIAMSEQTVFSPADVELDEVTDSIIKAIEEYKPQRLVLDSVSELSVLVDSFYQLRRQLLKLKRALSKHKCTSILTAGEAREQDNKSIQTIVHGVIMLHQHAPAYGPPRRRLLVTKMRGMVYIGGYHDFRIHTGGLRVYPRVRMLTEPPKRKPQKIASDNEEIDTLLGGGLEEGTSCLIVATHGVFNGAEREIDASYLADTVVVMRHFEAMGRMRRCIAAVKKRYGRHETTIREVEISAGGFRVGPPLNEFSGILTGTPQYEGSRGKLMKEREKQA